MHTHPIYVKQMSYSTDRYQKYNMTGRLRRYLRGGKSAGHDYIQALFQFLRKHDYKQSGIDPCIFGRTTSQATIFLAITIDDFLIVSDKLAAIDPFYRTFATKYQLKRFGHPTNFLGCTMQYSHDDSIKLRNPKLVHISIANANMADANGRHKTFPFDTDLNPSIPSNTLIHYIS